GESRWLARQIRRGGTPMTGVSGLMLNGDFEMGGLFCAMFLLSTGEMLTLPFSATVAIQRSSLSTQGAYVGFNSLAFAAANIFSPFLGTYTAEHYGYQTLWTITGVLLICCGIGFYWIISRMQKH